MYLCNMIYALWFNNLSLAAKLLRFSPIAGDLIFIDKVFLCAHSYENFENTFGEFFRVYHRFEVVRLQSDWAATTALTVKKQMKSRLQCARRIQNAKYLLANWA